MWNSNSIIAWILERSGFDAAAIAPPLAGGPQLAAGIAVARCTQVPRSPCALVEQQRRAGVAVVGGAEVRELGAFEGGVQTRRRQFWRQR